MLDRPKTFNNPRGFTLIELLIVISIIAVLSAIALASYTQLTKNARDAKRQSDLKLMQSALEQYNGDQRFYPDSLPASGSQMTSSSGNATTPLPSPAKVYLNSIPADPLPSPHLQYAYYGVPPNCNSGTNNKCTSYCLDAQMENTSNSLPSCSFPTGYNFVVTPP